MNHDPLCPMLRPCNYPAHDAMGHCRICGRGCQCHLIRSVRADEREQAAQRMRGFIGRNFPVSPAVSAMEAAMHAINDTPIADLPAWLKPDSD